MRILLVWSAADWSTNDVARGYQGALERLGHEVRVFPYNRWIEYHGYALEGFAKQESDQERQLASLQLASEKSVIDAMRHEAEVVLIISGMGYHPDSLVLLKRAGFKVALLCTESPYNDEEQGYLAQFVDLITVNDRATLDRLRHPNLHYLPHAYDPDVHRPLCVGQEYQSDAFFVGTGFAERQAVLESCDWTGIDLRLYGYWLALSAHSPLVPHLVRKTLPNEEAVKFYCGAKVGLNLHRDGAGWSANPRVFELAACGVHQLVDDRRPEVRELFGDAVCTFSGAWDFEDRLRACLADPEHRRRKAQEALERVQGHTFEARARELLSWL